MHPWIAGRIIENMQHEARSRADESRLGRVATQHRPPLQAEAREPREPRRERVGLAVARLGLRLAGRDTTPLTPAYVHAHARSHPGRTR
jgi:hypothetical protein